MSALLAHGCSDDHTLITAVRKHGPSTRVAVFHYRSSEAESPAGLAHAQFNGVDKIGLRIRLDIQQQTG